MTHSLTVIDRYIGKEILSAWVSVFVILVLVVMSVETVQLLSWLAEGRIAGEVFVPFLINGLFEFSVLLIPLSILMGVLLGFGRLYKDSEMTAIMAAGMGPAHWYRPLLLLAVPVSLVMLLLMLYIMPLIAEQRDRLAEEASQKSEISSLFAGRFNMSRSGDAIFFLEQKSEQGAASVMSHVFFRQLERTQNHINIAKTARHLTRSDGSSYIIMENGNHYVGNPGEAGLRIIDYEEYGIFLSNNQQPAETGVKRSVKSMASSELWHSDTLAHSAELQWRITIPLATLIIALLALPLSQTSPRSGRYAKLAWAIIIYLVYSNLLGVARTWIVQGVVPPWIGTWWVHMLALLLLFIMLVKSGYMQATRKRGTEAGVS